MANDSHHPIALEPQHLPDGGIVYSLSTGSGPLTLEKLESLLVAISTSPVIVPLLLISDTLTLPVLHGDELTRWIAKAGEYRWAQELWKQQGGLLLSLVTETLIGGTYLIHGLAARHRLVYPDTLIYPALPPDHYEAVTHKSYPHPNDAQIALAKGLVTTIVTKESQSATLQALIAH